jgi:hypothetical protein
LLRLWDALADENTRKRIALVSSTAVVVLAGAWQVYLHIVDHELPPTTAAQPAIAERPAVMNTVPRGERPKASVRIDARGANIDGDARIEEVTIEGTDTANIGVSVKADRDFHGSAVVRGVRITGTRGKTP